MFELFSTPRYCQWNIHIHYAQYTGEWNVEGKSYDRSNVKAHIGVALARELWGDRFQVVIATHCNTGHYHNHFVINSVSDVDGKKFYNSPADYRRMREVSDRLCREAKISVIEFYDTGVTAEYGDQLLTLSTCEYTYPNGRFVVVAKKV